MTKSSEHSPNSENSSGEAMLNIPKSPGVMINPGFKDDPFLNSDGKQRKFFANSQDRKNFLYIFLALVIFLVIFILLEFKQAKDAKLEKESTPPVPAQTN